MYVINATISVHCVLLTMYASHADKIIGVTVVSFRVPVHAKYVHQKQTVRAVAQVTGEATVSTVAFLVQVRVINLKDVYMDAKVATIKI